MKRLIYILACLIAMPSILMAQDSLSVSRRIFLWNEPVNEIISLSYSNPAINQYRNSISLSDINASIYSYKEEEAIDMQKGDGENFWQCGASSYMKHNTSTLWGYAYYSKGEKKNIKYNETSDIDLIYPYLTADSIGGNLTQEIYSLSGGYADHYGKWGWGAVLNYEAGLYYRNIDPRPKNVTGLLDLTIGATYSMTENNLIGVSLMAQKYKQSSDMMFISELGKVKIYHLTGLGNHYYRFAGTSENSHYDGYKYALNINLFPKNKRGIVASIILSRYQFKKILTDLNKLPLCKAWQNEIAMQGGYVTSTWGVTANFKAYRRHGIENIFGDAQSNVYPLIGSIDMYADNQYHFSLNAAYKYDLSYDKNLNFNANIGYADRKQKYVEPYIAVSQHNTYGNLKTNYNQIINDKWNIIAEIACGTYTDDLNYISPSINVYRKINRRFTIGTDISYRYASHKSISSHTLSATIKLRF